ncbi:hypothetical protein Goshw_007158 [Gossypium schwendimanii]|uniref:Uncharacterized protein n=1 Tax=Gossypium schwendimanii TaxID=34291 RepID=A0A7J9L8C3_GOSSC|nr:hypothetical protein [Gossypium schwendimanii]
MMVDIPPVSGVSWKDKLLGRRGPGPSDGANDMDLEIEDGDILRSTINGTISRSSHGRLILTLKTFSKCGYGLVGTVAKLDIKTGSGARGQFARMEVFVDLEKLLTSQVLINGRVH